MPYPYDESHVLGFCADASTAYRNAGQAWDSAAGVWVGRMQFDAAMTMGYPAARQKHLAALNAALGQEPAPGPTPPTPGPIEPRPPLPPFDPNSVDPDTGAFLPVYRSLREEPPGPTVGWWRGDAWGLTVPGLPAVPGGADGPAQERVLTYFLDRYGTSWEAEILARYVAAGYTHISLSPQDSQAFGTSQDAYVAMAVRCRAAGLFVHHLMRSKYYTAGKGAPKTPPDPALQRLRERFRRPPIPAQYGAAPDLTAPDVLIERLLAEGAMQIETPAWEMNHWSPSTCRQMIDHDSDLIGMRCIIAIHFFPHYISWQENHLTPTDFWRDNYGRVDSVLYQDDPYWTAGMMAARSQDCLDRLAPGGIWRLRDSGRGHPIWFHRWETIATAQFNNDNDGDNRLADEDQGNLKGYEGINSPGLMTVQGFGNGGRRPDGSPL
jgi:hypothetical protein